MEGLGKDFKMNKQKDLVLAKVKKDKKKYKEVYIWNEKYKYWVLEQRLIKDKKKKEKDV